MKNKFMRDYKYEGSREPNNPWNHRAINTSKSNLLEQYQNRKREADLRLVRNRSNTMNTMEVDDMLDPIRVALLKARQAEYALSVNQQTIRALLDGNADLESKVSNLNRKIAALKSANQSLKYQLNKVEDVPPKEVVVEVPKAPIHKKAYKFVSPDGELFEIDNVSEFSRSKDLNRSALSRLKDGKVPHHKGWTLYKEKGD